MANYSAIKAAVNAYIKANGRKEITGMILNSVLNATIDSLGRFFQFAGGAIPADDPGTPDQNVCYLATEPGVYTNFGGITIEIEEVALLFWNGTWTKQRILIGIREVTASVDNNVGTPSVDVSYSAGVLVLTFHNLKGEQGETGDPAGFGTIGADITGGVGTPGVSVVTSGGNDAKNIMFHFTNLKGETGVTSVVATIDNTSGTPSCQVSLAGGVLTLAFSGLKGIKGDTGVSADYPITIYNGLDSDATDQALSAAQGKVLKDELTQLEAIVNDNFTLPIATSSGYYNTNVSSGGTHSSSSTVQGVYMPCSPGDVFVIYGVAASSNYYRLFALYNSSQERVDRFANDGNYRTNPYVLTIPEGVAYVAINLSAYDSSTDKILKATSLQDLSIRIDSEDTKITEVNNKVIRLAKWGNSFTLAVGEYGYKTDTKKIRYNTGNGVVDVPFYDGAVYRYGKNLYYWDASASEMTLFFRDIVDDVATLGEEMDRVGYTTTIFELSSLIASTGDNYGKPSSTTYTNRARSKDFVTAPFKFSVPPGYRIYYVFAYALDAVLNTSNAVSARNYSNVSVKSINIQDDTKKYRILISKDDATQDVDLDTINGQSTFASGLFLDEGGIGFGKYYGCTNYPSHFTTYASLISAYDALASKYPDLITKTALGLDGQGVSIYEYTIKSRTYNSEGNRGTLDSVGDKPLIAIMAGVHGGETSTINGLYYLVRDILEGVAPVSTILGNINLRIIPCVCPYGFDNKSRTNANGVNINRNFDADWVYQDAGTNDYSGPSAASELETQIAQAWLQDVHADGAVLAIDWHNSGYSNEISCFCTKRNTMTGTMDIKKNYLFSAYSIINVLRQCYKVADTANWGYTSVSGGAGYSNTYMDKIGQLGCYFETSNDVDGAGTYTLVTDACNASVMGNVLIGLGELFGIS